MLGHVNNAVYLSYFESARVAYGLHLTGTPDIGGLTFIVAEATVTYLRQAGYGDELEVGARVSRIGTKSFTMEYGLRDRRTGDLVARGSTVLVWFDYAANRSMPVPEAFRAAVARDNA
jgi:acyl-CoA thioester hydrolase